MTYLLVNLTIAGVLLLGLAALHVALPGFLGWHRELSGVSLLNRQVSYVHCFFIGLACLLWGLLALLGGRPLLEPGTVNRLVLTGAVAFWACRLAIQLLIFNKNASRSFRWLLLSAGATWLWLYLTAVFTWALAAQAG